MSLPFFAYRWWHGHGNWHWKGGFGAVLWQPAGNVPRSAQNMQLTLWKNHRLVQTSTVYSLFALRMHPTFKPFQNWEQVESEEDDHQQMQHQRHLSFNRADLNAHVVCEGHSKARCYKMWHGYGYHLTAWKAPPCTKKKSSIIILDPIALPIYTILYLFDPIWCSSRWSSCPCFYIIY